nr:hypothetical protein [Bradyrhizobium barranii]
MGYRDANEASWSQLADVERASCAGCWDGGFGHFNNARLLARTLRQRGADGIALEDSYFPKTNSLIGERHPLADIDEFSSRPLACREGYGRGRFWCLLPASKR